MKNLNKKQLIIIDKEIKTYEEVEKEIYNLRKRINKSEKLEIKYDKSFEFLYQLWAGLLEDMDIIIVDEKIDRVLSNKSDLNMEIDKKSFFIENNTNSVIEFRGKIYSICDLLKFIDKAVNKKIVKKSDVFYSFGSLKKEIKKEIIDDEEKIYNLFLTFILPLMLNAKLIINNECLKTFKNHKATVFIGNRKEIRLLHNGMLNIFNKNTLLENFYHIFKGWDNSLFSIYINKVLFFNGYKSLEKIIAKNHKDLKGIWLDFESLGIELYSLDAIKENFSLEKQDE